MTFALGGVGGPLIGGLLTQADLFGLVWRPIFLINLPIGVLAMVAGLALLRDSRVPQAPRLETGWDWPGHARPAALLGKDAGLG
jgi:MFS family permease